MEEEVISLKDLWRAIKRGYRLIICAAFLGCFFSLVLSITVIKPEYSETSYVKSDVPINEVLINTYAQFVQSNTYLEAVSKGLKKENLNISVPELSEMFEYVWPLNTQVMEFKITVNKPYGKVVAKELADQFLNLAVDELPENIFYTYPEVADQTIAEVNNILLSNISSQSPDDDFVTKRTIIDDQVRLSITNIFENFNKELIKKGNFKLYTYPNPNKNQYLSQLIVNCILGLVIGVVFGFIITYILKATSDTVSNAQFLSDKFGLTNLGVISDK